MFITGRKMQKWREIFSTAVCVCACVQCSGSCTVLRLWCLNYAQKHTHARTHTHKLLLTSRRLQLLLNHFGERTADSCTSSQDTMHDPWNTIPLSVITPHCTVPQARLIHFIPFKLSHPFRISTQNFVPDNYQPSPFLSSSQRPIFYGIRKSTCLSRCNSR